jgi:hypothetical protein
MDRLWNVLGNTQRKPWSKTTTQFHLILPWTLRVQRNGVFKDIPVEGDPIPPHWNTRRVVFFVLQYNAYLPTFGLRAWYNNVTQEVNVVYASEHDELFARVYHFIPAAMLARAPGVDRVDVLERLWRAVKRSGHLDANWPWLDDHWENEPSPVYFWYQSAVMQAVAGFFNKRCVGSSLTLLSTSRYVSHCLEIKRETRGFVEVLRPVPDWLAGLKTWPIEHGVLLIDTSEVLRDPVYVTARQKPCL